MFQFQFQDDYYDILKIPPECTKKDIIRAYRKLALKWHPDKNKAKDAHYMFVKIAEAYEILSDPMKRSKYDAYYFSEKTRFGEQKTPKTHKKSAETSKNEADDTYKWEFSFKNPFDIFRNFFPDLDSKVLNVFSKAVSHMKKATDHTFLLKLMDEYRYFAKNKKYKYNDDENKEGDTYTKEPNDFNHDSFDEYRRKKRRTYLKQKYNADIKFNYSSRYTDSSHKTPPKQIYELEISLNEYLQNSIKRIHLPMLAKCFTCSIERRCGCSICKGDLYYESTKIYPIPLNEYEVYFPEGGNFLPEYDRACDFVVYCEDKYDKFYKRIGKCHLYTYIYWDGHDAIFRYIDGSYYCLELYKNKMNRTASENEPCDFSNNVLRIDNMGLPDLINNKRGRGDLFIRFTQDNEYNLDEDMIRQAREYLKCHPENEIIPSEILQIDEILAHFT